MKTYYKVVSEGYSAIANYKPVIYKLSEWARPLIEGSKLFVFDDLDIAKQFNVADSKLYECKVKNPVTPYGDYIPDFLNHRAIESYWATGVELRKKKMNIPKNMPKLSWNNRQTCPAHTIFVSAVKLIKEIKY